MVLGGWVASGRLVLVGLVGSGLVGCLGWFWAAVSGWLGGWVGCFWVGSWWLGAAVVVFGQPLSFLGSNFSFEAVILVFGQPFSFFGSHVCFVADFRATFWGRFWAATVGQGLCRLW